MTERQNFDTTHTKIFVGGIPWITRNEGLRRYFQQFGEIIHVNVVCDSQTNRSKGYGFVTFKDAESATRACVDGNPIIDGRKANCNLASDGKNVNHNEFNIIGSPLHDLCHLSPTFRQSQQQLANFHQPAYYWNQHYQQHLPLQPSYYALYQQPQQQYYEQYQLQQQYYGPFQPQPQYYGPFQPQPQYYEQNQPQQQYYGPFQLQSQYAPQFMNMPKETKVGSQASTSSSLPSTPKSSSSLHTTPKSSVE